VLHVLLEYNDSKQQEDIIPAGLTRLTISKKASFFVLDGSYNIDTV
jgi:hypothetical protein